MRFASCVFTVAKLTSCLHNYWCTMCYYNVQSHYLNPNKPSYLDLSSFWCPQEPQHLETHQLRVNIELVMWLSNHSNAGAHHKIKNN